MNSQLESIECDIEDNLIKCNKPVEIDHGGRVIKLFSSTPLRLIAKTSIDRSLICTGPDFQVYVWINEKYMIWYLPEGTNYCVLFNNVFLDQCDEKLYVISKEPYGCDKLVLSNCERELYKLLFIKDMPFFIIKEELGIPITNVANIVIQGNVENCHAKLTLLSDK